MKRLCFGGSFNPIHHGHLICARAVAEQAGYDRVTLIPSRQPPHKQEDTNIADAAERLAMCRLAIADDPLFEVNDIELQRASVSYTIDTARELQRNGWDRVHWLIGADMAMYLPQWHDTVSLLAEVHFVLMARPGSNLDWLALPPEFRSLQSRVVSAPLLDISSTNLRERIRTGQPVTYMTPPAVVGYIRSKNLYR